MSKSGSDHFSDLEEEASEESSPAERGVLPKERGLSDVSVPEVIQGAKPEELLLEKNLLGDFEREYLHLQLNEASLEPKCTKSLIRKRGQPINESTDFQRVVRSRISTRSPSPRSFNSPTRGQPRTPAAAEEPSNPLSRSARADEVLWEKKEFVRNPFLFLQDDIYPATNKVPTGREIEQRFVEQVYQAPSFV
jgi:hypothetical protein